MLAGTYNIFDFCGVCKCVSLYLLPIEYKKYTYSTITVTTYLQRVAILAASHIKGPFRGFQAEVRTGLRLAWDGPQTPLIHPSTSILTNTRDVYFIFINTQMQLAAIKGGKKETSHGQNSTSAHFKPSSPRI